MRSQSRPVGVAIERPGRARAEPGIAGAEEVCRLPGVTVSEAILRSSILFAIALFCSAVITGCKKTTYSVLRGIGVEIEFREIVHELKAIAAIGLVEVKYFIAAVCALRKGKGDM